MSVFDAPVSFSQSRIAELSRAISCGDSPLMPSSLCLSCMPLSQERNPAISIREGAIRPGSICASFSSPIPIRAVTAIA